MLVNVLLRVSGAVSPRKKVPPLLVNPVPPLLKGKVRDSIDECNRSSDVSPSVLSPPRVKVVAAPRVKLFGPTCTVLVLFSVPPIVRLAPPSKPDRKSVV